MCLCVCVRGGVCAVRSGDNGKLAVNMYVNICIYTRIYVYICKYMHRK